MGKGDCGCGYTDPRDNYFARVSYEYTFRKTSSEHKAWLGTLPKQRRINLGRQRVLMCHGSPRLINEFLWESSTPNGLVEKFLRDYRIDVTITTHVAETHARLLQRDADENLGQ